MKRINKILLSAICLGASLPLGGCSSCVIKTTSNEAYFYYADFETSTQGLVFETYSISVEDKKIYDYAEEYSYGTNKESYLNGGTQKQDSLDIPEGYEGVESHIRNLGDYVNVAGYVREGKLYGFLNRFIVDGGVRFGNGYTYCVEDIDYSEVFEYDPNAEKSEDKFKVVGEKFEGCNSVAIKGDVLIYWKENRYYSYNLVSGEETFLVDDMAYNSGTLEKAFTVIGTGTATSGDYTVMHMHKTMSDSARYDYFYLYEYSTLTFTELIKE